MKDVNWTKEWKVIETKWGSLLSYNIPILNERCAESMYQPSITDLIESEEYDIFLDVGSYVGYFTLVASQYYKKVIAYEASPVIYGLLLYNARFLENVECKYKWVSCKGDVPKTNLRPFDMVRLKGFERYNVEVVTLDEELEDLMDERVLIKMDVEGNELKALKGASEVLKHPNIHWQVDIHGDIRDEVISVFQGRDIDDSRTNIIVRGETKND